VSASGLTAVEPLTTRETVERETPAAAATCSIVGRDIWFSFAADGGVLGPFDELRDPEKVVPFRGPSIPTPPPSIAGEVDPGSRTGGWLVRLPVRAGGVRTLAG